MMYFIVASHTIFTVSFCIAENFITPVLVFMLLELKVNIPLCW